MTNLEEIYIKKEGGRLVFDPGAVEAHATVCDGARPQVALPAAPLLCGKARENGL